MTVNPFSFGNPITDPVRFYNRKNEIRQIVNRLLSSAHESTSVVGERRIGKTSLLKHLANPTVAGEHGLTRDQYCLIYIDFQGLIGITPQRFWRRVFKFMERSICEPTLLPAIQALGRQEEFDLFDLEDLFAMASDLGLNIVLFMDEFEVITQNPKFGADFFGGLRSLAIHANLSLVTATQHALVDLCHSEEVKSSPFFNIFATVNLRPFSRDDSHNLIEGYVQQTELAFTPEEIELILALGGGHPFFLQMAGFYLFDLKSQRFSGTDLLNRVRGEFISQADSHFQYFWDNCSESEKITLLAVIAMGKQKPTSRAIANLENLARLYPQAHIDLPALIGRGFLLEKVSGYYLFSTMLEDWILREIMALPGSEESPASVEEWVEKSGFENKHEAMSVIKKFKKHYWPALGTLINDLSLELIRVGFSELVIKGMIQS